MPAVRTDCMQNRFKLRVWDPMLNKGAIWTYWKGAYRDTGRDEGATMVLQTANRKGWFWYIPLHDDLVSVGVVAPFDYLFKGRGDREQTYDEEVERCPAVKQRVAGATRVPAISRPRTIRIARRRSPATDGCSSATRSAFSIRCIRPAFCWLSDPASWPPTRSSKASRKATCRRPARQVGPLFNQGVDRMRRLVCEYYDGFSFGQFVRTYPDLRGTVTDLLIGDLFTDRVDKVWGPMESLYEPGKSPIPPWNGEAAPEIAANKVNELFLPDGAKP